MNLYTLNEKYYLIHNLKNQFLLHNFGPINSVELEKHNIFDKYLDKSDHKFIKHNNSEIQIICLDLDFEAYFGDSNFKCFNIDELPFYEINEVIYKNLDLAIPNLREKQIQEFEKAIIAKYELIKKNDRVYYVSAENIQISFQLIYLLKSLAIFKKIPMIRCCLHINDDCNIHEMIMIHAEPLTVGPLMQHKQSISYHIIDGELEIELYKGVGNKYTISSRADSNNLSMRLSAEKYRIVRSKSKYCIFLEVASGPFVDSDTHWLVN